MRILLLTGEYPPMQGGIADYTASLASALAEAGHEIAVLTSREAAGATTPGVEVLPRIILWNVRTWREIARLARRYDLVHIQYQAAAFGMGIAPQLLPWMLRQVARRPVVTTFHDLRVPYLFPKAGPLRERSVRHMARSSSLVIATNSEDNGTLERWGTRLVVTIPIGVSLPLDSPPKEPSTWRARWQIPPSAPLLTHFGFVNRSKGIDTLLRAVAHLRESRDDVHLLMLGERLGASDPSNRQYLVEIEALAEELALAAPHLQWTGPLSGEEVVEGLRAADVVVLPYRDGASWRRTTLIAPISLGCPIVTTMREPARPIDFLGSNRGALFAVPGDHVGIATQIARLLEEDALRHHLVEGNPHLSEHFGWERIVDQHLKWYKMVKR